MIRADKAHRIMKLYERDYDNFLNKLKKKADGAAKKDSALAQKTLQEAKDYKATHLAQKAKDLLGKNGGIAGVQQTVQNVMKYMKDNSPSDYAVSVGDTTNTNAKTQVNPTDKRIAGMPPVVVYAGGGIALIGLIWWLSTFAKKHQDELIARQGNPTNITH
jgi:hypothetical protein